MEAVEEPVRKVIDYILQKLHGSPQEQESSAWTSTEDQSTASSATDHQTTATASSRSTTIKVSRNDRGKCSAPIRQGRCQLCGESIRENATWAGLKLYHPQCFRCKLCEKTIENTFYVKDDKVYCEPCFVEKVLPKCSKCCGKIDGKHIEALGKKFHNCCLGCVICGKTFPEGKFYVVDEKPYCLDDHWGVRTKKLLENDK